ncbi:MAG: hypothetical protein JNJ90_16755 [Saprospiraceae bacterium]|jgi:hypothetical protein|nr:hypothetical protein [Saprospiraceae bacterium]
MFANIALFLTFVVYISLVQFSKIKPPGGDYGVGYAWSFIFLGLGLFITSLLATIAIGAGGGFSWAPGQGIGGKLLIGVGWAVFCVATLACASYRMGLPDEFPFWLRWIFQSRGVIWWPLLSLVPAVLLANPNLASAGLSDKVQLLMKVVFCLNVAFCLSLYWGYKQVQARNLAARIEADDQRPDWEERNRVACIADTTARELWYAGHSAKTGVRQNAFVKVTSGSEWQADLLRVLSAEDDHWELYPFTADHSIDLPAGFEEALEQSIRRLAKQIREKNADRSFQKSLETDGLNISRLPEVLDQWFFDAQTDFRPAMRELQAAMAETLPGALPKERAAVEAWLKAHP